MVFKRMLSALGVGAPSVDTVLATTRVQPGGTLTGEVRLKGGDFDAEIEHVALGLVTRVESERGDTEQVGLIEFFRGQVSGPFTLRPGEDRVLPFHIGVPWETPVTEVMGHRLRGMAMGVRTELAIAKAVDKGDMDDFHVTPLPSQEAVLRAFDRLGFAFKSADLEVGHLFGVNQHLPFYQEIEFAPPPAHRGRINEVELTFVATPAGLDIILEADKRSRFGMGGGDAIARWQTTHHDAPHRDWPTELTTWLNTLTPFSGGSGHGTYGRHDHHGGGIGLGGIAAAGAAGLIGGFVAAEALDEIGDFFEGD
ncbi:sporulation protein [Sphaerisporangium aureirubrum]|uniref:Sporulation protein n=1 Tax=Sphaerisporangium aureirubrum TaxID=1544736 RepID=A0ABW1NW37_9ACTN